MSRPRVATWLMARLGPPESPLVGDLDEEWAAGRGRVWFWRQVLTAIVSACVRDIRAHKLLTIRALSPV